MTRFAVHPPRGVIDTPLDVRLRDLPPGRPATIHAAFRDDAGQIWASRATFIADPAGVITLATARPSDGTYTAPDPLGLLWSMQAPPADDPTRGLPWPYETTQSLTPLAVALRAESDDGVVAEATVERLFLAEGVERADLSADGLGATLFLPPGPGPHPAALVVGGSAGGFGWSIQMAALLAAHGRAALAVAYLAIVAQPPKR